MPRGVLSATCSDGARSAASYGGAGAGILTARGGGSWPRSVWEAPAALEARADWSWHYKVPSACLR